MYTHGIKPLESIGLTDCYPLRYDSDRVDDDNDDNNDRTTRDGDGVWRTEVSKRTSRRDRASRIPRPRCTGRCGPTCVRTYAAYNVGAAEGKNKVGVSRPRYVRACTRQREIRGHKPAYYAPPRATNTPNNGRGSARRGGRPVSLRVCV